MTREEKSVPIRIDCEHCGREYRLADDKAGKRIRCSDCQGVIEVRPPRKRNSPPRRQVEQRRAPASASAGRRRRPPQKKSTGGLDPKLVKGGVFAAIAGVASVVAFLGLRTMLGGPAEPPSEQNPVVASTTGEAGLSGSGTSAADLTDEQKAQKDAEYKATLEQKRRENAQNARAAMEKRYGAGNVVTVVVKDVVGDTDAAHKYLNRKVFRAAYAVYQQSQKQATQQTEQNRRNAEQQAVSDHKKTWGEFGPAWVEYRYKVVESDTPYPRVVNGGRLDNTFTYFAAPAGNLQQFADRVGVGVVQNAGGQKIEIASQLPTPIPDPDVEELVLQHGAEKVVHVSVKDAHGDPPSVQLFLENNVTAPLTGRRKSLVAFKALGDGRYDFTVGPVANVQVFSESLQWGTVDNLDLQMNELVISANLPDPLPTREELAAAKKEADAREKEIREADRNHRPRPGESELDWAVRTIRDRDTWGIGKALKALTYIDVEEERRDEVSRLLIQNLGDHYFKLKELLPAMLHWRNDDTETALLRHGGSRLASWDKEVMMEALAELGTEKSAQALATALPDFFAADKSVPHLIKMGPVAEEAVLAFGKHKDAKVRTRVYAILMEIGGRESLKALRNNPRLENTPQMKSAAEMCIDTIKERLAEAKEASEMKSDDIDKT